MKIFEVESEFSTELIDENLGIVRISTEGGHIDVMENARWAPVTNSIVAFYVEPEYRGRGIGDKLIKEAMRRYSDLGGQASSEESLHLFYKNGFRNISEPDLDFNGLLGRLKSDSSVFMKDMQ